ncbi:MAG TPA: hypothetical protein VMT91_10730, partial [Anaerolineales bacterium]|nr:hypothetical protein [Anaerolineales bacterium]
ANHRFRMDLMELNYGNERKIIVAPLRFRQPADFGCGNSRHFEHAYNGLGDSLQETSSPLAGTGDVTTTFTLDIVSGLS